MKLVNKLTALENNKLENKSFMSANYDNYYREFVTEKEIGFMGNECRFIVKLLNSFQTQVSV
jgi:hypothetical protein